ncbi:MAG: YwqG family protein [Pseudomonadota bacterium]
MQKQRIDNKNTLEKLGVEKFGDVFRYLLPFIEPCVMFKPSGAKATLGTSKLGGLPDLPANQTWPQAPNGQYLNFIGQFNLGEMPIHLDGPKEGMLYIFLGEVYSYNDKYPHVIFSNELPQKNSFCPQPENMFSPTVTEGLVECAVEYSKGLSILNMKDLAKAEGYDEFEKQCINIKNSSVNDDVIGQTLQWINPEDYGSYLGALFTGFGLCKYPKSCRQLLCIPSFLEAKVLWGDAGWLAFYIMPEDFEQLNFSHTMAFINSGE